jgi:hypothetical protein
MNGINDAAEGEGSPLSHLASDAVTKLCCRDFASYRAAARDAAELFSGIWREAVGMYDPTSPDGFSDLITYFSSLFADKREAAAVFGVALSTFYRWKSGDTIPHALVRATIRDTISRHLRERQFDEASSVGVNLRAVTPRRRPN